MKSTEPILQENKDRFVMFPIAHKEIWKLYKTAESRFWFVNLDLAGERKLFAQLEPRQQQFVKYALTAQVIKHKIFGERSLHRYLSEVQYPEARCFYGFAEMMGNIHFELISEMQAGLSESQNEAEVLVSQMREWSSVKAIYDWVENNYFNEESFPKRLIAYACCRRILFAGVTSGLISFGAGKILEDVPMLQTFFYDDEGHYIDFSLTLYAQLESKESPAVARNLIHEVMLLESAFLKEFKEKAKNLRLAEEDINRYIAYLASCIEEAAIHSSKFAKENNPFKTLQWERSFTTIDKNKKEFVMDKTIKLDVDF